MPPTSIDGTDITGATIDGTDVTEITVDGDTVFTSEINVVAEADLDHWIQWRGSPVDLKGNMGTLSTIGSPTIQSSGGVNDPYPGGDGNDSQYAEFDGTNDAYQTSSAGTFVLDDADHTVMIWYNPDSTTPRQDLTNHGQGRLGFSIGYQSNDIHVYKFDGSFHHIAGGTPDTSKWSHLCATYDFGASLLEFYVDGVSQGTVTSGNTDNPNFPNYWGQFQTGDARYDGKLDDFRVYSKVLSQSEIDDIIANTDPN